MRRLSWNYSAFRFILFALTLLGVALFHHHTLQVALTGLAVITLYKLGFTGFKTGPGLGGLALHLAHEWVILANLLGLLLGFALLSNHFEESRIPAELPSFLPDDWKGPFVLLVMIFVLSSFLDNIAAALIGGTIAGTVFRGKVHIGYLAAIVAASNAGGSGSVVGDTTTTMMWIDGVSPLDVLEAFVGAGVAMAIFGIPASLQQHRYSPITKDVPPGISVDWARVTIVAIILASAIVANVIVNLKFANLSDRFPFIGAAVWVALLATAPWRQPDWKLLPDAFKGSIFLLSLILCASMMPVEKLPAGVVADGARPGLRLGGVRQHPAHRARAQAGRLRLGLPRLRGGLRRLDDLVRLERRGRAREHVSGGEIGRPVAAARLACGARLRDRVLRAARGAGMASERKAGQDRRGAASRGAVRGGLTKVKFPGFCIPESSCGGWYGGTRIRTVSRSIHTRPYRPPRDTNPRRRHSMSNQDKPQSSRRKFLTGARQRPRPARRRSASR